MAYGAIMEPAQLASLRERNRVGNRAATIDAAFALFASRGFDHVTVADICAAAGIGRRTFFRYFATKDDVLTEPAREMTARVAAAIAAAPDDMPEPLVLRHALTEIASYALTHRARMRQLAEVRKSSAGIRSSPLARLSEQELRLAWQLALPRPPRRSGLAHPADGGPGRGRPAGLARRHHRRRMPRSVAAPGPDLRHRAAAGVPGQERFNRGS